MGKTRTCGHCGGTGTARHLCCGKKSGVNYPGAESRCCACYGRGYHSEDEPFSFRR